MPAKPAKPIPVIGPPEEKPSGHGRLKVFLGYAAGAGKTYQMLDEAQRRKARGQDVVIGAVDPHGRKPTEELIAGFEIIPPAEHKHNGLAYKEMDTAAIISRNPQLVLVDELQHTNAPGSANEKRWQDIEEIQRAGINVLTTLDVQHLESLNDLIMDITGIRIQETVPDRVLQAADEVEMVDATPRALIHRLERGDVFPGEGASEEIAGVFREGALSALRELALREIAERVDEDVLEYRREKRIERPFAARDRIMICVSPTQPSLRLIRRGWRTGQRLRGDVVAVTVEEDTLSEREEKIVEEDFRLAEKLGIPTVRLKGDASEELIRYAKENNITQLVIGHSSRTRMHELLRPSIVNALLRELRNTDILVVAREKGSEER